MMTCFTPSPADGRITCISSTAHAAATPARRSPSKAPIARCVAVPASLASPPCQMSSAKSASRRAPARSNPPEIREHKIPTPGSKPYIAMEGFDGCLWFCESGTSKIGRLRSATPRASPNSTCRPRTPCRSASPSAATATTGSARRAPTRSAASRRSGEVTEFPLPTPNAGPDGILNGPDGNVWFSETEVEPDRPHHAGRQDHRIQGRHHARLEAAVVLGARRRAVVQRGLRQPDRPHHMDGKVTEFPIPSHDSQPRATIAHPDGSIWFVETSTNALGRIDRDGRITEHQGDDAERVAARRLRRAGRRSVGHRELRQQDRRAWRRTAP